MSRFLTKILNDPPGRRQESEHVGAHAEESGRPQSTAVDANPEKVDAKTPTLMPRVDAKPPTPRPSGRQAKKQVGAHKSDRHIGDRVRQHFRIRPDLDDKVRMFRAQYRLDLQEFYELAAAHYMECVDAKKEVGVDAVASPDDRDMMILFKTEPSIINLYLRYNPENRWKPGDDHEGQKYNGKDIRLIEFGIIQTQFNARFKKVNSFKYYTTEIDIALETPLNEETIEVMMKHAKRRWQEAAGK